MRSLGASGSDANSTQTAAGGPDVVMSGSDTDTDQCGMERQLGNEDDRYCRYCGYSRKKCVACGESLSLAENSCGKDTTEKFCPSCGAPRGGPQVIRKPNGSGPGNSIGSFLKYLGAPVIVATIAALILAQPTVPRSTAQNLLRPTSQGSPMVRKGVSYMTKT